MEALRDFENNEKYSAGSYTDYGVIVTGSFGPSGLKMGYTTNLNATAPGSIKDDDFMVFCSNTLVRKSYLENNNVRDIYNYLNTNNLLDFQQV